MKINMLLLILLIFVCLTLTSSYIINTLSIKHYNKKNLIFQLSMKDEKNNELSTEETVEKYGLEAGVINL